jgi:class I fructose-bisphosphate aldolase
MDSGTGKRIRLGRLFDSESGRGIILAYSHGLLLGPQLGQRTLEDMATTIKACASAEAIMISPGLIPHLEFGFVGRDRPSLVVHLDWTNFSRKVLPYEEGTQVSIAAVEEVAAAGADAVMSYLLLGFDAPDREAVEIDRNARLARVCDRLGIALMIEPRYAQESRHPDRKLDLAVMQLYCRIAAEVGADLVKVVWPGSVAAMREIVDTCPAPVLVAGGAHNREDPDAAFRIARDAVAGGARGLVFGRNIYQSADPGKTLMLLREIMHGADRADGRSQASSGTPHGR